MVILQYIAIWIIIIARLLTTFCLVKDKMHVLTIYITFKDMSVCLVQPKPHDFIVLVSVKSTWCLHSMKTCKTVYVYGHVLSGFLYRFISQSFHFEDFHLNFPFETNLTSRFNNSLSVATSRKALKLCKRRW